MSAPYPRNCVVCGIEFLSIYSRQIACSKICRHVRHRKVENINRKYTPRVRTAGDRERERGRYMANRQKIIDRGTAWRIANPERHREVRRAWRAANMEKDYEQARARYATNREKIRAQRNKNSNEFNKRQRNDYIVREAAFTVLCDFGILLDDKRPECQRDRYAKRSA